MKSTTSWIRISLFFMVTLMFPNILSAATLDWDVVGWPGTTPATTNQTYLNVDGSGVNINVSMTGDTNRFTSNTPYDVTDAIVYYPDYADNVEQITTTITFSSPVKLTGLRWRDIDSGTFNDHIIISAIDTNGAGDALIGVFLSYLDSLDSEGALREAVDYATKVCLVGGPRL